MKKEKIFFSIFLLLLAIVSIQAGASIAKGLFAEVGIVAAAESRLVLATLFLWIFFTPWKKPIPKRLWRTVVLYGLSLGGANLLFYCALDRMPLGITVVLEFLGPLTVALISSHRKKDAAWVVLALIGIVMLMPMENSDRLDPMGVIFALGAGTCWGLYIVYGKKALSVIEPSLLVSWGMLIGSLIVFPLFLFVGGEWIWTGKFFMIASGVAILSSAVPFFLELFAMRALPLKTFGVMMSLEPAIAALCGFLILREDLTFTQWGAICFIMAASIGSSATPRRKEPEVPFS